MQNLLKHSRYNERLNPNRMARDIQKFLDDPTGGVAPAGRNSPLTPREEYALRLVAELIGVLRPGAVAQVTQRSRRFVFGHNEIDARCREVTADGKAVHLTPRQYEVLFALAEAQGAPVSRDELRRTVWQDSISPRSRAIDQTILELRQKLEPDPANPRYIRLASKFGYCLTGTWMDAEENRSA